jgi:hypothetical protein
MKTECSVTAKGRAITLAVSFFPSREDFSWCRQSLRVLRAPKSLNTEFTEMLGVLRVKA